MVLKSNNDSVPILYSLHNCPYAIRARLALFKAQQRVLMRSIKLDNKPSEMLEASPKGSVPVLVISQSEQKDGLAPNQVLEESLDIMIWALGKNDPDNLMRSDNPDALPRMLEIIELRKVCEAELIKLESRLTEHTFLLSNQESLVDIAILPFIRKYARIDKQWFRQSPYPNLKAWLNGYIQSSQFSNVMKNYDVWLEERRDEFFGS